MLPNHVSNFSDSRQIAEDDAVHFGSFLAPAAQLLSQEKGFPKVFIYFSHEISFLARDLARENSSHDFYWKFNID